MLTKIVMKNNKLLKSCCGSEFHHVMVFCDLRIVLICTKNKAKCLTVISLKPRHDAVSICIVPMIQHD